MVCNYKTWARPELLTNSEFMCANVCRVAEIIIKLCTNKVCIGQIKRKHENLAQSEETFLFFALFKWRI